MEKTKKLKKGDGAKPEKCWAVVTLPGHLCPKNRRTGINRWLCGYTQGTVKTRALKNSAWQFKEETYGKTWVVRKVIIQLAD